MNVTVITWLGGGNYGTSLQSYALCHKLAFLGYNVSFLLYFDRHFGWKSWVKGCLSVIGLMQWKEKRKYRGTQSLEKLYRFQKENYQIETVYFPWQYQRLLKNTDVFITGSDQIWNAWHSFNPFYFLDFAPKRKKIAYASSIGTTDFPERHKNEIRNLLSCFSHIGVREQAGVYAISSLLQRDDIIQVLDPTFLLEEKEWKNLSREAMIEINLPSRYILCYLIGENQHYIEQVEVVRETYGIADVIIIPAVENKNFTVPGAKVYNGAGPKEFIHLIQNATVVCTDSFHATAISINLSVNFVEFLRFKDSDKKSQNSRIYDVLDRYGLHSRLYSNETDVWTMPIDYKPIQVLLAKDRNKSVDFLINSIKY